MDSISWLAIMLGRTLLITCCIGSMSEVLRIPITLSASRTADNSGLVTTIASLQAASAFLNPSSTPAGQSTKTKSNFSLSSSLIFFISSGFIQSNILGSPAGRRARLGSFLCLTNAWSRRQFLSRTS